MIHCPKCGELNTEGAFYCTSCGEKLDENIEYCPRCRERLNPGAVYCHKCGLPLHDEDDDKYEPRTSKKRYGAVVFWIALLLLAIGLAYYFGSPNSLPLSEDEHVTFVKNGTPVDYPDVTYDEAFSNFFSNRSWRYFESDTGLDVVEFKGDCLYYDTQVTATIQFVLDMEEGTFEMEYLAFNDVPQTYLISYALITKAFSEYQ